MEACGGAQHWARELTKLGHEVVMLPAKAVKAFVMGNKSTPSTPGDLDGRSPRRHQAGGCEDRGAAGHAGSAPHQAAIGQGSTMQINEVRGLLTEYGEVFAKGRAALSRGIADALERLGARLRRFVIDSLQEQWERVGRVDEQVAQIETRLKTLLKEDRNAQRLMAIPGVGLLTATAISAAMGRAMPSSLGVSSLPGWVWCRRIPVPAARRGCLESVSAETRICVRFSSTAPAACSRAANISAHGSSRLASGVP
jgi:hypothetical protein